MVQYKSVVSIQFTAFNTRLNVQRSLSLVIDFDFLVFAGRGMM